jgi:hypothetical protein
MRWWRRARSRRKVDAAHTARSSQHAGAAAAEALNAHALRALPTLAA